MNRRFSVLLGVIVLFGLLASCTGRVKPLTKTSSPKEEPYQFARAIWLVEKEREDLIMEYQAFTKKFMDMPTTEVFRKADYFLNRHAELRQRMLGISPYNADSMAIRNKFLQAYDKEQEAYFKARESLRTGNIGQLLEAQRLFLQADGLYLAAYDELDALLGKFNMKWEDIER